MYSLAESHLRKSILRTKSIASAPALLSWIPSKLNESIKPQTSAQANVQARLFNSEPVKKAMDDSMGYICASLGLDNPRGVKKKRVRKADFGSHPNRSSIKEGSTATFENRIGIEHDLESNFSATDEPRFHGSDQAGDSDESVIYKNYGARVAGSSEDSDAGFPEETDYEGLSEKPSKDASRSLSLSPLPGPPEPVFVSDTIPPTITQIRGKPIANVKATTFLPSLMTSGYWSGSETASDDEGGFGKVQRKNRRGQRERRLIAEKKYGQNANHLKKERKAQARDQGWDTRRGAQANDRKGDRGKYNGGTVRGPLGFRTAKAKGAASSSGANSDPVGPRRTVEKGKPVEGPLHPSWQAAKSAKEQKKAATFQGKKVLFD